MVPVVKSSSYQKTAAVLSAVAAAASVCAVLAPSGAGADPSPAPNPGPSTDDKGFVGTAAHCEGAAMAIAYGRTQRSLVTICGGPDGEYQYRGVRLGDDAALMLSAKPGPSGGYIATNEGVTYTVSSTELVVTSGDATIYRGAMVEYHEPRLAAEVTTAVPPGS